MARTAPVPNLPPIPGMCPSIAVLGGGGDGGGGSGKGAGDGGGGDPNGGDGSGDTAAGDGSGTGACGLGEGGGCPNHHGGSGSGTSAQGDPVDFATGRVFTASVEDAAYEGAWPVRFRRTYSNGQLDVGFGKGFTHTFGWSIAEGRTAITIRTPEGTAVELPLIPEGEALLGPHGWLVHREGAGFRIDLVGGQTLQLEPGKMEGLHVLTAVIDNRRNTTVLEYAGGLLQSVTDPVGRKLRFVRDDAHVAKLLAIDPRATDPGSAAMIEVANFIYDDRGRLVCARDAESFATRYDYDDLDRLVRLVKPGGTAFHYRYDDAGRCVETWGEHELGTPDPSLDASVPDTLRDDKTKARGIHHVVLQFGEGGFRDAVDSVNTHRGIANEHGKFDQLVSGGRAYQRTYDTQGFLSTFTDSAGNTMRYVRDVRGRELLIEDADGGATRIERYPNGDVHRITDAAGGVTEVFPTPAGFAFRNPIDALFQVALDDRGRMIETIAPDGTRTGIEYDVFANVSRRTVTTRGASTTFQYDAWGRCIGMQAPDGAVTRLSWSLRGKLLSFDAPGSSFRFAYDGNNDITSVVGPGGTTTLEYGLNGRVHRVQPPVGSAFEFFYDREGRSVRLRSAGAEHIYERRPDGLVSVERTADGRTLHYRYDESGRLTEQRCGTIRTSLERDRRGRVIKRIHGDGVEESFAFDVVGNLVSATRGGTKVTFRRNALGWILGESQTIGGDTVDVRTDYDQVGKLRHLETSIGHVFDVERPTPGELHMELDGERVRSTEDVLGREIQRKLSGGGVVSSRYDDLGRLVQQISAKPDRRSSDAPAWVGATPEHVAIESLYQFKGAELVASSSTQTGSVQFDYDPLGRLLRALPTSTAATSFRYDERGQPYEAGRERSFESGRILRDGGRTFEYDAANRLIATVDTNERGEVATTRHRWLGGRLAKSELPDGRIVEYVYDAFGRRLQKRTVHRRKVISETRFVWESTRLLHELTTTKGAATGKTYCFGARGDTPWAERKLLGEGDLKSPTWRNVGNWSFYLVDPTGAPHATVTSTGALETSWRRTVWGKAEGQAPTALRVLGQYADSETGLHYNWHRYYDPGTGRYISPDPLGVVDGLDPFSYADNSPTSLVDPTGLMFTIIRDSSGAIIHRGENVAAGGGTTNINPALGGARGSCSETGALNSLANSMSGTPEENRAEIARRFNDGEITMETFEGNREDFESSTARQNDARRQNPCPQCSQLLQDMNIRTGVVGVNPGTGRSGTWRPTWRMIPGRGRKR